MRTYIAIIDAEYKNNQGVRSGMMTSCPTLYAELDQNCCIGFRSNFIATPEGAELCVIVYGKPFYDNERYVVRQVVHACRIWGLGFDDNLAAHIHVRETMAEDVLTHIASCGDISLKSVLAMANSAELYMALREAGAFVTESLVSRGQGKDEMLRRAANTPYGKNLVAELERIYDSMSECASRASNSVQGTRIPVHYMLDGAGTPDFKGAFDLLSSTLAGAGRVPSSHAYFLNFDYVESPSRYHRLDELMNDNFASSIAENLIVLQYSERDDDGNDFRIEDYKYFTDAVRLLNGHLENTQIVFAVPCGSKKLQERIEAAFMAPLVTIFRDQGSAAWAQADVFESLEGLARHEGVEPDASMETLLARHMSNRSEHSVEEVFDEWKALRETGKGFPQYSKCFERFFEPPRSTSSPFERLDSLIGLTEQKLLIHDIIDRLHMNTMLAKAGLPTRPFSKHMAFMGSPGTGKTEVARLYGEILRCEGVLPEGRLIITSPSEMGNRSRIFERARGSVLFIDEAYALAFCPGLVTDLIAYMENYREDTVVILAGYTKQVQNVLDSNPGFRSRIGFTVEFPDYTPDQMLEIFELMARNADVDLDGGATDAVRDELSKAGRRADQGNARYVRKLFEDALGAQQVRLAKELKDEDDLESIKTALQLLTAEDVRRIDAGDKAIAPARERFENLVGLTDVKNVISSHLTYACVQKTRRDAGMEQGFIPMHMAFMGNPGTGKTEVARLVAQILKEEGVLSVGELFECGRQDLVSPVVGMTAPMIKSLFELAKGSVIFIDEAYSLLDGNGGGHGDEAINAIVQCMEGMRDEVVVIFAGYEREMEELMAHNPGLTSRVKTKVTFPDYSPDELWQIQKFMASERGFLLADEVEPRFTELIEPLIGEPDFGNARVVRNMLEDAIVAQACRIADKLKEGEFEAVDSPAVTLKPEDFKAPTGVSGAHARHPIGFV